MIELQDMRERERERERDKSVREHFKVMREVSYHMRQGKKCVFLLYKILGNVICTCKLRTILSCPV